MNDDNAKEKFSRKEFLIIFPKDRTLFCSYVRSMDSALLTSHKVKRIAFEFLEITNRITHASCYGKLLLHYFVTVHVTVKKNTAPGKFIQLQTTQK
jgi:hypothetical protein